MSGKAASILGFFVIVAVIVGGIQSCTHKHEWVDATCTEPRTCSTCEKTEGEPLGHKWLDATCTAPKTCSICNETWGNPIRHTWEKATCTEPKTCAICGTTKGVALGHNFYQLNWVTSQRPTCQTEGLESNTCQRCNETKTNPIPVVSCVAGEWQTVEEESTSTCIIKAQYCYMCGKEIDRKQLILSSSSDNYDTDSSTNNGKGNFNTYNNTAQQETSASYVLNKSTKKFHHPYCDSVKKIAPKNYKTSSESRSTLIKLGYSPCGKCSP